MPETTQASAGYMRIHHVVLGIYTSPHSQGKKIQNHVSTPPGELKAGEDEELKTLLGLPKKEMERCARIQSLFAAVGSQQGVKKVWIQREIPLFFAKNF